MVRVPIGNHRSMRTEVRAVAPDANPYLALYSIFKTGIDGEISTVGGLREGGKFLPDNIQQAIEDFQDSAWIANILGADVQGRYSELKQAAANRSPRELGTFVKGSEVQFHHEVYNQSLWRVIPAPSGSDSGENQQEWRSLMKLRPFCFACPFLE